MKKLSIILSLALMPMFAACGNANSKTSETSAAGNENVIRTTSDKIIVISNYHDDIQKDAKDASFWSYRETPEGSAFTCKGPKGEQTFVFAEKYNLAQYGDVVFATDFGEQKIAPFGSYMDGSFGLAEDYPTVGIALETNGHILLLIREHSTQTFTGYKIIKDNIILKDKNGKKVRFIQFEGKSTDPNAVYKFNLGILPLYTPTNSPAKSSADNLNDKIKGMNNVRVF